MIEKLIASWYLIKIFLSPVFMAILVITIVGSIFGFNQWLCLLFVPALIIGILIAERARRGAGTVEYWSSPMNTPDLEETWRKERDREANDQN